MNDNEDATEDLHRLAEQWDHRRTAAAKAGADSAVKVYRQCAHELRDALTAAEQQPTLGELVEYLVRRGQATGRVLLEIEHEPVGDDIPDNFDWRVDYRTGRGDHVDGWHWCVNGWGDSAEAAVRDVLAKRGWTS